jgi:hypothetical protein
MADWTLATPELREIVEFYLGVKRMQSMNGAFGGPSKYSMVDYDKAVAEQDTNKFLDILGDVWLRAPESQDVYRDEAFCLLCNICDGSQGDFVPAEAQE